MEAKRGRSRFRGHRVGFFRGQLGIAVGLRAADGGRRMNPLYVLAAATALALLVYLFLALLKPEWFG